MNKKKLYTDINIQRIEDFVSDHVRKTKNLDGDVPPFSSVEFSINGSCNRRCFFCPRVDKEKYPNIPTPLKFSIFEKLVNELSSINFSGRISFSGFCEPLLTKNLHEYILIIKNKLPQVTTEIVSNGDPLLGKNGIDRLIKLFDSGLSNIRISLYDGPHQDNVFLEIKEKAKLNDDQFIIRKRYLGPEESYGLTISNRAGSVKLKNEVFELKPLSEPLKNSCYYPFYKVLIDYNGDVLMCSNDWKKDMIMGNITNESFIGIWSNEKFLALRKKLSNSDRNHKPCNVCDVNGMMNGQENFNRWQKYFNK